MSRNVHISPRKVRLITQSIKHFSIDHCLSALGIMHKRGARELAKTIRSAIANATHNGRSDGKNLMIAGITVSEGPALKRYHPSTRGRIHPYKKRSSHIRVLLKEKEKKGEKNGAKS